MQVDTPLPIPNGEVKHFDTDDTAICGKVGNCQSLGAKLTKS